jgi:hypothetical protein
MRKETDKLGQILAYASYISTEKQIIGSVLNKQEGARGLIETTPLMPGTRRSTRSSVANQPAPTRTVRTRARSKTREESDKENTPPKHTNTQTTGNNF